MSSCCTLRLKRRRAFSRDSPSCSRISAKQTHPQTRPEGQSSYYKDLTGSQVGVGENVAEGRNGSSRMRTDRTRGLQILVQLKAQGLGELSLMEVEGVEPLYAELEGGCDVQ
jgi:hypothetical protein